MIDFTKKEITVQEFLQNRNLTGQEEGSIACLMLLEYLEEKAISQKPSYILCPRCRGAGVVKRKKIRSLEQNKYYWGVVVLMIAEQMGEDKETVHEILKNKFNPIRVVLPDQTISEYGGETKKLDTKQFGEYISLIKRWSFEFMEITIPEPNQLSETFLIDLEKRYHSMINFS